jgi:hypothetical protein
MGTDLMVTTLTAWGLFSVTGVGIAVLPWSDAELHATVRAFATVGRAVVSLAR